MSTHKFIERVCWLCVALAMVVTVVFMNGEAIGIKAASKVMGYETRLFDTAEVHTIEHLAATYLRNQPEWKDRVIYFGPMGCRTGFYLILAGELTSREVLPLVRDCFCFIGGYSGEVPGASAKDCGNYLDMNLPMANYWGRRYSALLENIDDTRLIYPE